uniref:F-box domain-containing protein n=1 Tax=Parastrongyloides trichosuri TaxID=131310 RepID=A0A0N4Z5R5_PARTI
MSNVDIQKQIDESTSLNEICDIVKRNEKNNFKVHKVFNNPTNQFVIATEITKTYKNFEKVILSKTTSIDITSIEEFKKRVHDFPLMEREMVPFFDVIIYISTKNMSKNDKNILAEKCASIIEFIFDAHPNCNSFQIQNKNNRYGNDDILFRIIKNIKSKKVETIMFQNIFEIINYAKRFDLLECNLKENMPNLILEIIISVFPKTITTLSYHGGKIMKFVFNKIASQFPELDTINFDLNSEICEDGLLEIKSLKNVEIGDENLVKIPEWVEYVNITCSKMESVPNHKDNKYYFELMDSSFDCSLRRIGNGIILNITFLRNILNWQSIAPQFPELDTINFDLNSEICEYGLLEIKSLKNVEIGDENLVKIPEWVEYVNITCSRMESIPNHKDNKYYFELMDSSFDCSLRRIGNGIILNITFLRNILNWQSVMKKCKWK